MHPENKVHVEEYFNLSRNYNCRILVIDEHNTEATINNHQFGCPASINIKGLKTSNEINYLILMKPDEDNVHVCCRALHFEDIGERLFEIGQGMVKLTGKNKGVKSVKDLISQPENGLNWKELKILLEVSDKVQETQSKLLNLGNKSKKISNPSVSIGATFIGALSSVRKVEYSPVDLNDYMSIPRTIDIVDYYEIKEKEKNEPLSPLAVTKVENPMINKKLTVDIKLVTEKFGKSSANLMYSSMIIPPFIPKIKDLNLENPAYKCGPKTPLVKPQNIPIKIMPKLPDQYSHPHSQRTSILNESSKLVPKASTKIGNGEIKLLDLHEKKVKIDNFIQRDSSKFLKPHSRSQSIDNKTTENELLSEFSGNDLIKNKGVNEGNIHLKGIKDMESIPFVIAAEEEEKKPKISFSVNAFENIEKSHQKFSVKTEEYKVDAYMNAPLKVDESKKNVTEYAPLKVKENEEKIHPKDNPRIPIPPPLPKEYFTIPSNNFENKESSMNNFTNPNLPCPPSYRVGENQIDLRTYFEELPNAPPTLPNFSKDESKVKTFPTILNNMQPPPLFTANIPVLSSVPVQKNGVPLAPNTNFNVNPVPDPSNNIPPPLPLYTNLPSSDSLPRNDHRWPPPPQLFNTSSPIPSPAPPNNNSIPPPQSSNTDLPILNSIPFDKNILPPFPKILNTPTSQLPPNQEFIPPFPSSNTNYHAPPLLPLNTNIPNPNLVPSNINQVLPPSLDSFYSEVPSGPNRVPPPLLFNSNLPFTNSENLNQSSKIPYLPLTVIKPDSNLAPPNISSIPAPPLNINPLINPIPSNKNSIPPPNLIKPIFPSDPNSDFPAPKTSSKPFENEENLNWMPKNPEKLENLPRPIELGKPSTNFSANDLFKKKDKGPEKPFPIDQAPRIIPNEEVKHNWPNLPNLPNHSSNNLNEKNFQPINRFSSNAILNQPYKPTSMHPELPPWPGNEHLNLGGKTVNFLPEVPKNYQNIIQRQEVKGFNPKVPESNIHFNIPSLPEENNSSSNSESSSSSSSSIVNKLIQPPIREESKESGIFKENSPEIVTPSKKKFVVQEDSPEIIVSYNKETKKPGYDTICKMCLEDGVDLEAKLGCGCINCMLCLGESYLLRQCVKCKKMMDIVEIKKLSIYFA